MTDSQPLASQLSALSPGDAQYAVAFVNRLLAALPSANASDVHLLPTPDGLDVRWRKDGVLQPLGVFPAGTASNVVARLKVLADLLTYRTDVPQEGRIRTSGAGIDMRLSTFPTLHGEKAVLRLFATTNQYQHLDELGLPGPITPLLRRLLGETSGAILIAGPAGSGKTTTAYACLREVVFATSGGRNVVSLEDPVEVPVRGVAQSQVNAAAGFTLTQGLRSLLRQDPEVILVGEIRDAESAQIALQASLTGQLVLTTFHAGSAAGALCRLADIGIEPYVLRSGVLAVVCQRLARRLCDCARLTSDEEERLGLAVAPVRVPVGCTRCDGTGYRGRIVLAEMLTIDSPQVGSAILARSDINKMQQTAQAAAMTSLWDRALAAVSAGLTSPAEIRRVLGVGTAD